MLHVPEAGRAALGAEDKDDALQKQQGFFRGEDRARKDTCASGRLRYFTTSWFLGATGTNSNILPSPRVRMPVFFARDSRFSVVQV